MYQGKCRRARLAGEETLRAVKGVLRGIRLGDTGNFAGPWQHPSVDCQACCLVCCRSETNVLATHLCHYRGFNFWRFDLTILCGLPQRTVEYIVVLASDHAFTFHNKCVLQGGRRGVHKHSAPNWYLG